MTLTVTTTAGYTGNEKFIHVEGDRGEVVDYLNSILDNGARCMVVGSHELVKGTGNPRWQDEIAVLVQVKGALP